MLQQDGADVELSWSMHVNPDTILSLDTEARGLCIIFHSEPVL